MRRPSAQSSWCVTFPPPVGTRVEVHVTQQRWLMNGVKPPFKKAGWYPAVVISTGVSTGVSTDDEDDESFDTVDLRFEDAVDWHPSNVRTGFGALNFEPSEYAIQVKVNWVRTLAMRPVQRLRRCITILLLARRMRAEALSRTLRDIARRYVPLGRFLRVCPGDLVWKIATSP